MAHKDLAMAIISDAIKDWVFGIKAQTPEYKKIYIEKYEERHKNDKKKRITGKQAYKEWMAREHIVSNMKSAKQFFLQQDSMFYLYSDYRIAGTWVKENCIKAAKYKAKYELTPEEMKEKNIYTMEEAIRDICHRIEIELNYKSISSDSSNRPREEF